jgi:putative hemolysin
MFTALPDPVLGQISPPGDTLLLQAGLVVLLIILNAAFAGSEMALVSLRETQISNLEDRGRAGRVLAALARDPNRYLSTIQVGITLAGFLASAAATVTFAELLVEPLAPLGAAARPVAIVLVTVLLTFLTLVFGELAPKRIALQRAEGWSMLAARPLSFLATATAPVIWVLTRTTDLTVRLLGGDPTRAREEITEEELRDLVATRPQFTSEQRTIIAGAFEIAERSLREIVVPRTKVFAVPEDQPADEAARALVAAGHSRAPVFRGDLDDVVGVVHLRDLVDADGPVGTYARPTIVLPETVDVLPALRRLRAQREHFAVVIDEHGGVEGIVTLEDLLEEIVGEIYDEFDRDLDPTDARGVQRRDDGSFVIPGSFPMHDLDDLGIELPEGEYATIAGMVLEQLGRLPDPGTVLDVEGWRVEVLSRRGNAIGELLLTPREGEPAADDEPEPDEAGTAQDRSPGDAADLPASASRPDQRGS